MKVTRSYIVRTFGCQMNEHDSERIAGLLESDGMEPTDSVDSADVVVLNTCCIRESADNKLYGALGQLKVLKSERPDMQIVVAGCLAQKDRDLIREKAAHVDVVFGTHNVHRAAELLKEARQYGPVVEILEETVAKDSDAFPSALPAKRELDHAAWVTIQTGCANSCAFCTVPAVRGPEISRPFGELIQEVESLASDGVSEVTFLGQNVNSFGRDLTVGLRTQEPAETDLWLAGQAWAAAPKRRARPIFGDLLRAAGAVPGVRRVRYTSPHPKDISADVMHAMADTPAVCEHLHLPLQAGSDTVLAAMHRGYTSQKFLEKVVQARSIVPDLAVTTDIIVGFPGETDADFEKTLEVAAEAQFDSAYTFVFSPRPGTEAADMTDHFVDHEVAVERYERLRVVIQRSALAKHLDRVGRTELLMVEGPSKRDPAITTGRTRQNKIVHFASPQPLKVGSVVETVITKAHGHYLLGEFQELIEAPRRRTRIPVVAG